MVMLNMKIPQKQVQVKIHFYLQDGRLFLEH